MKTRTTRGSPEAGNFFDHFEELQHRLIKSLLAVVAGAFLFYGVIDRVLAVLIRPVGHLVFTAPGEAFVTRVMLALVGGFFLALPVIIYQIWQFIAAGLRPNEVLHVRVFAPCSFLLFMAGALFAYFVAIPISVKFLLGFASDLIIPMITIKSYISFVGTMLLAFGVVFELPLVLMFLSRIGVATPAYLTQKRKHAIVIILIVSAVITPPDLVTQLILAVPLIVLYEIGVIASKLTYRPNN